VRYEVTYTLAGPGKATRDTRHAEQRERQFRSGCAVDLLGGRRPCYRELIISTNAEPLTRILATTRLVACTLSSLSPPLQLLLDTPNLHCCTLFSFQLNLHTHYSYSIPLIPPRNPLFCSTLHRPRRTGTALVRRQIPPETASESSVSPRQTLPPPPLQATIPLLHRPSAPNYRCKQEISLTSTLTTP
jgi:hypothetical protein